MTRKQFLKLGLGLAGAYVVGGTGARVLWEKYDLRLTEWEVPLPRLPRDLEGLRVAHLSDLHLSPEVPFDYLVESLEKSSQLGADVVVLTGDILSTYYKLIEPYRAALAAVSAPRGKYAVLGNHDYFSRRTRAVVTMLQETGWTVLRNESVPLPGTGGRVWLLGLDDPVTGHDDMDKTMHGVPPEAVRVMLAHTPDVIGPAAEHHVDLLLAGHTHGGQVVLPFIGPLAVPSEYGAKYAWGLFDYAGTRLEVTRGVGLVPPRVRFNCPPEIALLTLRRGEWPLSAGNPSLVTHPYRRLRLLRRRLFR
ncbi:MAG TPA: metallophosphoesterase [Armatimonadota bacterium]|jgi:hypothetical protein